MPSFKAGCRRPWTPDVVSPTPHAYTRTGHAESKFGVGAEEALELYRWARERPHLRARGLDVHIGSQILDPLPYFEALSRVLELVEPVRRLGAELHLYGVQFHPEVAHTPRGDEILSNLLLDGGSLHRRVRRSDPAPPSRRARRAGPEQGPTARHRPRTIRQPSSSNRRRWNRMVCDVERGRRNPTAMRLLSLAGTLGTTPSELLRTAEVILQNAHGAGEKGPALTLHDRVDDP